MLDERIYRYTNEMELNESFLGDVLVAFRSDFGGLEDADGIDECRESLSELGIVLPE